ncbi:hypothetical protein SNE40_002484 [Patella caerulea]|uniref:Solute carrier family 43 member 3 n=1 Tax=Patella caerulea TaxID=87958 RepID=A0AAN8K644_PATCE
MAVKGVDCISLLAVIWASFEIMTFAGIIFGWHNIVYIYKDQGYFNHLCPVVNQSQNNNGTMLNETFPNSSKYSLNDEVVTVGIYANDSVKKDDLSCEDRYKLAAIEMRSNCREQDEQFNLIFTLSTFITGALCFLSGCFYDKCGTRACRILSMLCFIPGLLCLIVVKPESGVLLYPGFILITFGGYMVLFTNIQVANLIPPYRSMLIAILCGSYDVSSTILLFFKLAYENSGISPNTCFICMLIVYCLVVTFGTFCLLPRYRLPWPQPTKYKYRPFIYRLLVRKKSVTLENEGISRPLNKELTMDEFGSVMVYEDTLSQQIVIENDIVKFDGKDGKDVIELNGGKCKLVEENIKESDSKPKADEKRNPDNVIVPKFSKMLLSPLFLWDLMWMCFQRLRNWMFIGVFNPWMTRLACGDKSIVSHYTSFLSSTQFIGIFTAAFSGCVMDRKIKQNYNNIRKYERIHASIASFLMNCTVAMLLSIGMTIPVLQVQYLTCLLHTFHRSFLYGPNNAFIANAFPTEHFGKLVGISLTVSAIFGMLQYPLFLLIQGPFDNDPLVVNVLICVMILCTYLHPAYIWYFLRKKIAKNNF